VAETQKMLQIFCSLEGGSMTDELPTVLIAGHEVQPESLPKMPLRAYKLLIDNGWVAKCGYSQFQNPSGEYGPKAARAGQTYGGEKVDNHWIDAIHIDRKAKLTAVWHDGSFDHALVGLGLPDKVNSTAMNRFIKGEG